MNTLFVLLIKEMTNSLEYEGMQYDISSKCDALKLYVNKIISNEIKDEQIMPCKVRLYVLT
jgi:hypothetical protein